MKSETTTLQLAPHCHDSILADYTCLTVGDTTKNWINYAEIQEPSDLVCKVVTIVSMTFALQKTYRANRRLLAKVWNF